MSKLTAFEKREPNEAAMIKEMIEILQRKMGHDYSKGHTKRDAHPKTVGLLKASFQIEPDLPAELKVGLFKKERSLDCWVRLSNSSGKIQSYKAKDARGLAIKLLLPQAKGRAAATASNQDFVLLSTPTMPLGTIALFRDAVYYTIESSPLLLAAKFFLTGHAMVLLKLAGLRISPSSPLDIRYWSTTPYLFGEDRVVKYSVLPTSKYKTQPGEPSGDTYLTEVMQKHLNKHVASFDFCIQLRKDDMPVEDAAVEWDEKQSPFIKVATLQIPIQKFRTPEREEMAENLSFSPEHAMPEHKAIGGLNRARVAIYTALSKFRHKRDARENID